MNDSIEKHFLVAIRDSARCSQGVRFIGDFFNEKENFKITLLYVMQSMSLHPPLSESWGDSSSQAMPHLPDPAQKTISMCENFLCRTGVGKSSIFKKLIQKRTGTAKDILSEGKKGNYDAVVLGKRSTSFLSDIISGNIALEVLEKNFDFPIWFCKDPDPLRKNVLICLDGSDVGMRVADHVGFVLHGEKDKKVTLLHIDKGQNIDKPKLFEKAGKILIGHGVDEENIKAEVIESRRVVSTIIKSVNKGNFASLAVGLSGRTNRTGLQKFIAGEKCKQFFEEIENASLWIVP